MSELLIDMETHKHFTIYGFVRGDEGLLEAVIFDGDWKTIVLSNRYVPASMLYGITNTTIEVTDKFEGVTDCDNNYHNSGFGTPNLNPEVVARMKDFNDAYRNDNDDDYNNDEPYEDNGIGYSRGFIPR